MAGYEERLKALVIKLQEIDVLKFGDIKMKIGVNSPVYFDLRIIGSYPKVLEQLSELICEFARSSLESCDHVCGVPYAALSIATLVATRSEKSMIFRRKEAKNYGTKRMVEGCYTAGDSCVIVEDVVTSGLSIIETVGDLKAEGLNVTESIVVVDRQQGGSEQLSKRGIKMRSLLSLTEIVNILRSAGKMDDATVDTVKNYLENNRVHIPDEKVPLTLAPKVDTSSRLKMPYEVRAEKATNAVSAKLLRLMAEKRSTLCVAADVSSADKVLEIARAVGPYICLFKTHVDIISDFSQSFVKELQQIAKTHHFMIMEDKKFGDIGHTVGLQYGAGTHTIAQWADLVTAHALPGPGVVDGLVGALETLQVSPSERGCFIVAEMSSQGTLTTSTYRTAAVNLCESRPDFVAGVVSQSASGITSPGLVQLTPGVRAPQSSNGTNGDSVVAASGEDGLGQQYNSPSHVVLERGADVAVVGRGILQAKNPADAAKMYRNLLWKAYIERVA